METVLIVGATGNIGVSAVIAALRSGRKVLAVVRNQTSSDKLTRYVGTEKAKNITFAEADILSATGVSSVVDRVRAGELPAFQHVYSAAGGEYIPTSLKDFSIEQLRYNMSAGFEANLLTYRHTINYLLEQNNPSSTWTLCTGSQGDVARFPIPAMTQGPLFSMATAACRENASTNVRFNEIYLCFRVEVDEQAKEHGVTSSSEFASVYEGILGRSEIRSSRIRVETLADIRELKFKRKDE